MSDSTGAVEAEPVPNLAWQLSGDRCIRLLKLTAVIPATEETKEDSIFYSVVKFDLDECPPFIALSYTWSSPVRSDIYSTETNLSTGDQSVQTFYASIAKDAATDDWVRDEEGQLDILEHKTTRSGTKSLRDALVQLYRIGLGDFYFWADAVCIDQDNAREKEVQVAMMDDIYTAAQAVVVWLGPADTDFESWRWVHMDLLDALTRWVAAHSFEELQVQKPLDPQFTSRLEITPPGGSSWMECWEKYFRFYRRRTWFSRAWVVQEVTLAQNVMVQCGPESLSWDRLVALGKVIHALGWQLELAPDVSRGFGRAMADEIIRLSIIKDQLTAQQTSTKSPSVLVDKEEATVAEVGLLSPKEARRTWFEHFATLLQETRVYSATDPRDKIYAILGIAKRGLPPGMSMPIAPDYSDKSTARSTFTSVATMLVGELPDLKLLSLVQDKESTRSHGLPSWVPDWTCTLTGVPLVDLRDASCAFSCNPNNPEPREIFQISEDNLILRGAKHDHIVATCRPMWDVVKTQNIDDMLGLCEHLNPEYVALHSGIGEILWRTIIANTFNSKPALPSMADAFKAWAVARLAASVTPSVVVADASQGTGYRSNVHLDEASVRTRLDILNRLKAQDRNSGVEAKVPAGEDAPFPAATDAIPTVEDVLEKCRLIHYFKLFRVLSQYGSVTIGVQNSLPTIEEQVIRVEGQATAFQKAMAPTIPFRRLYRTAGGYLGLGPASAGVGDQLWMIRGARVPFVLRECKTVDGEFELLGETYLHGFMDGEMSMEGESYREVILQ